MSIDLSQVEKHVGCCLTRVYDEVAKTPERIPTTIAIGVYGYNGSATFYANYDDDQSFHCEAIEEISGNALAGFVIPEMEAWSLEGKPLRFLDADSRDEGEGAYEYLLEFIATATKRYLKQLPPFAWRPNRCLLYTSPSPRDLSTSRMPSSA